MNRALYILPFLIIVGVLFFLYKKGNKELGTVEEKEINTLVYGSGYVNSKDYVVVKAQVSGYVKEIFVEEGQPVRRGQLLAVIDHSSIDASIKEAQARLILVQDRLKEGSDYLRTFQSAVESARINLERTESAYERRERLFAQGLIPKEAYEQAKSAYESAQKEYERALASYKDAIKALEAENKAISAEIERLRIEREKHFIKSPTDGFVLKKWVNVGDYINSLSQDNRLFSVGSKDWEVVLEVDEEYAGLIREGQRVVLRLDAYPGKEFEGKVLRVIREVDRSRKLFQVKVYADLPEDILVGSTVDGYIDAGSKRVLLLPKRAYQDGYVVVYDGIRFVKKPVRVGRDMGDYYEVLEGLKKGDRVLLR